jgi:hypothetical protein
MTASFARGLGLCLLLGLCLGAGPALGDDVGAAPDVEIDDATQAQRAAPPAPGYERSDDDRSAVDDWEQRRHWKYDSGYFFVLSRGMDEAGFPRAARPFLLLVTVPIDIVQVPFAAIAGLFGS